MSGIDIELEPWENQALVEKKATIRRRIKRTQIAESAAFMIGTIVVITLVFMLAAAFGLTTFTIAGITAGVSIGICTAIAVGGTAYTIRRDTADVRLSNLARRETRTERIVCKIERGLAARDDPEKFHNVLRKAIEQEFQKEKMPQGREASKLVQKVLAIMDEPQNPTPSSVDAVRLKIKEAKITLLQEKKARGQKITENYYAKDRRYKTLGSSDKEALNHSHSNSQSSSTNRDSGQEPWF